MHSEPSCTTLGCTAHPLAHVSGAKRDGTIRHGEANSNLRRCERVLQNPYGNYAERKKHACRCFDCHRHNWLESTRHRRYTNNCTSQIQSAPRQRVETSARYCGVIGLDANKHTSYITSIQTDSQTLIRPHPCGLRQNMQCKTPQQHRASSFYHASTCAQQCTTHSAQSSVCWHAV